MPAPPLTPDGRPTLTVTQRRQQLEEARFLEVRHLAYLHYKKPDGTPLVGYEQTLDNREAVKSAVLGHEITAGWLIPDGTEGQIQVPAQPQPQPQLAAPQGAPQMQPFQPPPNGTPVPMQQAPAAMPQPPMFAQPPPQMQAPVPQMAPQQYAQPAPQMMAPPVASPQQAASVAPQQQEAPSTAPTGRKRRGQGTAVAPPPAAPPAQTAPVQVQQFPPPQQGQIPFGQPAPMGSPPPMFGAPAAFPGFNPGPQQAAPVPQQQTAATVDLTPVIGRIDALAKIIEAQNVELKILKTLSYQAMTVLQHLYLSHPELSKNAVGKNTLPDFQAWLQQFIGNPS